jgi:hypothetical protein
MADSVIWITEHYFDKECLGKDEVDAIRSECPLWNIVGNAR